LLNLPISIQDGSFGKPLRQFQLVLIEKEDWLAMDVGVLANKDLCPLPAFLKGFCKLDRIPSHSRGFDPAYEAGQLVFQKEEQEANYGGPCE